jgi:hypothetical protein
MVLADIATGNTAAADVCWLIAVILFVLYGLIGWYPRADGRVPTLLLGIGLACTALGLLLV